MVFTPKSESVLPKFLGALFEQNVQLFMIIFICAARARIFYRKARGLSVFSA